MRVQVHEVVGVHVCQRPLGELGIAACLQQGAERTDAAAHDPPSGHAELRERARHETDRLRIALLRAHADQLEAELRELARGAGVARGGAHDGRLVAQAQRKVSRCHAGAHDANDGQGVVGADDQKASVVIEEAKRRIGRTAARIEARLVFEQRRLDGAVAATLEMLPHRLRDVLARLRLVGQYVSESPWCGGHLRMLPSRAAVPGHASLRRRCPEVALV